MFLNFKFKMMLLALISGSQSVNTHLEQLSLYSNQKEFVEVALKDLKDILLEFQCFSFGENENFQFTYLPDFAEHAKFEEIKYFLDQPIKISSIEPRDIYKTETTVIEMLKHLEDTSKELTDIFPSFSGKKSLELTFFERLITAILLIHELKRHNAKIKSQNNFFINERQIRYAKMISTKLYNALLEVRHSSFLDYVVSSAKTYEFSIKLELANNIYSMAMLALVDLKKLLKN